MKKLTPALLLGLAALAPLNLSCGGKEDTPDVPAGEPQVTEWEKVVDGLAFPTSGDSKINRLTIGRKESNMNFANRGDIEVLYDQDKDLITIEMRKYDFADELSAFGDEATGEEGTFSRMSLWAYKDGASPSKPSQADMEDPEKNCQLGAWKDNCSVYVYYDGQSQPVRSGVDFRVHLPKAWRGELNVQTEDNDAEGSYPRRGNITIGGEGNAGLCSSGNIKMSSGVAKIRMCRDLTPAPTCSAAQIKGCEEYVDMNGEDAAWAETCGCPAMQFGQLRIESLKPFGANITVDMPDTTWLNATVANQSEAKPHDCKPRLTNCSGDKCNLKEDGEYSKAAEFNYPGGAAPSGAGFNLTVLSAGCADIKYIDSPEDWSPDGEPKEELRGILEVCTGCL